MPSTPHDVYDYPGYPFYILRSGYWTTIFVNVTLEGGAKWNNTTLIGWQTRNLTDPLGIPYRWGVYDYVPNYWTLPGYTLPQNIGSFRVTVSNPISYDGTSYIVPIHIFYGGGATPTDIINSPISSGGPSPGFGPFEGPAFEFSFSDFSPSRFAGGNWEGGYTIIPDSSLLDVNGIAVAKPQYRTEYRSYGIGYPPAEVFRVQCAKSYYYSIDQFALFRSVRGDNHYRIVDFAYSVGAFANCDSRTPPIGRNAKYLLSRIIRKDGYEIDDPLSIRTLSEPIPIDPHAIEESHNKMRHWRFVR